VRATLAERALLKGAGRVLVACSGGPDSQVLLHVLHALRDEHRCELLAASVDHGLRAEAPSEIAKAEALASGLGIPFVRLRVQVPSGPSKQAQARHVRYEALLACAVERQAERVAVGHTLDDQAETVLSRLLRGASLDGLAGIAPRRADGVVRPLIDARRSDVLVYAARHELPLAMDPSNRDAAYLRVRVRTRLLPLLNEENPRLSEHLAALADDAREAAYVLETEVKRVRRLLEQGASSVREESSFLKRSALKSLAEERTGRSLHRTHLTALERMLGEGGQVRLPGGHVASLDPDERLRFARVTKRGRGVMRPTRGTTD
jgi:tRNA(Ile)-lysidine synthase